VKGQGKKTGERRCFDIVGIILTVIDNFHLKIRKPVGCTAKQCLRSKNPYVDHEPT